jgi:hypothetical protein
VTVTPQGFEPLVSASRKAASWASRRWGRWGSYPMAGPVSKSERPAPGAAGPGHCTTTTPEIMSIPQANFTSPAFLGVKVTVTGLLSGSLALMP